MQSIHLILKKEEIDRDKLQEGEKVAVVLDVLLATSTIVSALSNGASKVIPVLSPADAAEKSNELDASQVLVAGELQARPVDGMIYPSPTLIGEMVAGKTLILSTTNGTVALGSSSAAKKVYIASMMNNPAVAAKIKRDHLDDTIVIVCSGNSGEFSQEDFYGAGHFIDCLLKDGKDFKLNDAAKAACVFYQSNSEKAYDILESSHVGRMFGKHGLQEDLLLAAERGSVTLVPELINGIIQGTESGKKPIEKGLKTFKGVKR